MSRIILTRYPNGDEKFVIGWDHPANGAFWQEFNEVSEDTDDLVEEVSRFGGMWPGIQLGAFKNAVPEDLRPLITEEVEDILRNHAFDPESGRIILNLTKERNE